VRQLTTFVLSAAAIAMVCVVYASAAQSPDTQESKSRGVPESGSQTVWSGVYTEAQAYRGEKVADTTCIGCHGPKLDGGDSGPKLVGDLFIANWSSQSVGELFSWLQEAMPAEAPGTLSKDEAAAVIAYIFKLNKLPAGKVELPTDREAMDRIAIVSAPPR
jgi:mono/diheme cytochrome c family protein